AVVRHRSPGARCPRPRLVQGPLHRALAAGPAPLGRLPQPNRLHDRELEVRAHRARLPADAHSRVQRSLHLQFPGRPKDPRCADGVPGRRRAHRPSLDLARHVALRCRPNRQVRGELEVRGACADRQRRARGSHLAHLQCSASARHSTDALDRAARTPRTPVHYLRGANRRAQGSAYPGGGICPARERLPRGVPADRRADLGVAGRLVGTGLARPRRRRPASGGARDVSGPSRLRTRAARADGGPRCSLHLRRPLAQRGDGGQAGRLSLGRVRERRPARAGRGRRGRPRLHRAHGRGPGGYPACLSRGPGARAPPWTGGAGVACAPRRRRLRASVGDSIPLDLARSGRRHPRPPAAHTASPPAMRTALSSTRLPPLLLPGAITGYLLLGLGNNSGLALAAMAVLVVGCALLWRPGEPPILLYIFGFQWLQAAIGIFHANLKGLTINELALQENAPGHTDLATMLCLIGLVLLAVGMRIGAGPQRLFDIRLASSVVARRPLLVWFKLLAVAWLIATLAQHLAPLLPGLSQPLLALANLQWAFFFIATYATFSRADASKTLWLIAFALELAGSLGGYFSSFRSVFLFTLIAILAAGVRLRPAQLLAVGAVFAVMVMLGVVWTAVKVEYRPYLSGGENTQTVTVGYLDRLEKMAQIASNLTGSDLSDAADRMIARIAYTNFFGSALDYVPQ